MDTTSLPSVSAALLAALEDMFPDQCPRLDDTDRMVWFRAGQRNVVEVLREHYRRQTESTLERSP